MWVCRALSAWMTSPSASKERLIFWASFSLSPSAPDFQTLSEPARSTRFNLPEERNFRVKLQSDEDCHLWICDWILPRHINCVFFPSRVKSREFGIYLALALACTHLEDSNKEYWNCYILVWLTSSFGPRCEVCALNGDAEQSMWAGAVLVHLSAKGDPVSSSCG